MSICLLTAETPGVIHSWKSKCLSPGSVSALLRFSRTVGTWLIGFVQVRPTSSTLDKG